MQWGAHLANREWKRWFAWYPVRVANTSGWSYYFHWVWLEWIERRELDTDHNGYDLAGTQYRLPATN